MKLTNIDGTYWLTTKGNNYKVVKLTNVDRVYLILEVIYPDTGEILYYQYNIVKDQARKLPIK